MATLQSFIKTRLSRTHNSAQSFVVIMIALVILCSLAACSGDDPDFVTDPAPPLSQNVAEDCLPWSSGLYEIASELSWEGELRIMICPAGDGPKMADEEAYLHLILGGTYVELCPTHQFTLFLDAFRSPHCVEEAATDWWRREFTDSWIGGGSNETYVNLVEIEDLSNPGDPDTVFLDTDPRLTYSSPDINNDGVVNVIDLARFSVLYNNGVYDLAADFTLDGVENAADVGAFAKHFGHGTAGQAAPSEDELAAMRKQLAKLADRQ